MTFSDDFFKFLISDCEALLTIVDNWRYINLFYYLFCLVS